MAKNAKNGISAKTLEPWESLFEINIIWGMFLSTCIGPHPFLLFVFFMSHPKKGPKVVLGKYVSRHHTLIYILVRKYVCLGIMVKHLDYKAETRVSTCGHDNGCGFIIVTSTGRYFG